MVWWLRVHAPSAGGLGLIPGQGTRSRVLQVRVHMTQLKIPRATAKIRYSQININTHTHKYSF